MMHKLCICIPYWGENLLFVQLPVEKQHSMNIFTFNPNFSYDLSSWIEQTKIIRMNGICEFVGLFAFIRYNYILSIRLKRANCESDRLTSRLISSLISSYSVQFSSSDFFNLLFFAIWFYFYYICISTWAFHIISYYWSA